MIARILFGFLFVFFYIISVRAQQSANPPIETKEVEVEAPYDEEDLMEPEIKMLPQSFLDSQKVKPEYAYLKNLDSLLKNYKENLPEEKKGNSSKSFLDIGLIKILLWSFAIFAVLYILYQFIGGQGQLFYKNKYAETQSKEGGPEEFILPPLQLSQQAAQRGDFRQAVRYQYAYLLQLLGEKKHLNILPQKTSQHYIHELGSKPFVPDFSRLTLQYEYVWFGNMHPNKEQYELINEGYRNFFSKWL